MKHPNRTSGSLAVVATAILVVTASTEPAAGGRTDEIYAYTALSCQARVPAKVLPPWARAGFSASKPRMPFLLGANGSIVAILWADPLQSPPPKSHNNKILWVSRASTRPGSDLRISAQQLSRSRPLGQPIQRVVEGGPGPSIIDLPHAGCYELTLRWSGHTDRLDLEYVR
jgi:hypothetical protein